MIKKRDKKIKFNIVDGFVVLLAVICIASIVNKALVVTDKYDYNRPIEHRVEFVIENVDEVKTAAIDNIKSGDTVVRYPNGDEFGTIDGEITYNEDGLTAHGTIVVNAVAESGGLRLDDTFLITVGSEIVVATEKVQITVKIVAVQ